MRKKLDTTIKDTPSKDPKKLREGLDYYLENGLMVFTEYFLKKRGYCCKSGCRHCPYGFKKDKPGVSEKGESFSS